MPKVKRRERLGNTKPITISCDQITIALGKHVAAETGISFSAAIGLLVLRAGLDNPSWSAVISERVQAEMERNQGAIVEDRDNGASRIARSLMGEYADTYFNALHERGIVRK